ncbi:VOC family protein [Alkalihalobacillus sp. AL-G]|uniref:VOC family protein n=1 Tax=Alkalihalobacillus sp. AL-G TaxID=2926399 RepID=UPI00272C77DA|nr:VOC family protein [Alkalihalobacillus sp. AL-G]WLD93771.1 VOC family protein [Alkalihalobacillus sp. AL-G]
MKGVKRIDAVFVPVTDIERSEKWYLEMFPFRVVFRSSDGIYVGFRFNDNESESDLKTALTLHKVERMPERSHIPFNFYTEDVEGFHSYLADKGIEVGQIHSAEGMRFFEFSDPDGNTMEAVTF